MELERDETEEVAGKKRKAAGDAPARARHSCCANLRDTEGAIAEIAKRRENSEPTPAEPNSVEKRRKDQKRSEAEECCTNGRKRSNVGTGCVQPNTNEVDILYVERGKSRKGKASRSYIEQQEG